MKGVRGVDRKGVHAPVRSWLYERLVCLADEDAPQGLASFPWLALLVRMAGENPALAH